MALKDFLILFFFVTALPGVGLTPLGAAHAGKIDGISIITPQWEGQTNPDGSGLFFEIVKRVYEPAGIKMTFSFAPWKRAQKIIAAKEADAMLCAWQEDALTEGQITPRFPLFVEHTGVVFRKDRVVSWEGLQSLNGKSAVWIRGYDYHTSQRLSGITLQEWTEVDDFDRAWLLLKKERCDVYMDALIDLERYITAKRVDMTPYRLEVLWRENTYVAFAPTERSRRLMEIFDERIQVLFRSGELKKIHDKWGARFFPEAWNSSLPKESK